MGKEEDIVFDTREFKRPIKKGSSQAMRGLVCFLFACVMLASSFIGVLGGAWFYAKNRPASVTTPAALQPTERQMSTPLSLGASASAVVPVCVAAGDSYEIGSGIVVTEDGYLLTCDHLFDGMRSPTVCATLSDGTVTPCVYVGGDDRLDLAVLKMEVRQMVCLPLDPSASAATGQTVAAIGCRESTCAAPTVTSGVISSSGTRVSKDGEYPLRRIQTDAPVSPGCSGGALVGADGSLLGMIQAKVVSTGVEGVAYALPVDVIVSVIDDLIRNGRLSSRVKLGMTVSYVPLVVGEATGNAAGLRIERLTSGSALASLGVSAGDVICAVNGEPLRSLDIFFDRLEAAQEEDSLLLTVVHPDGSERQVGLPVAFEKGTNHFHS